MDDGVLRRNVGGEKVSSTSPALLDEGIYANISKTKD